MRRRCFETIRDRNSDRLIGLLYLGSLLRASTLNRVGRNILHAIATEAATLVENARLVQAERAANLLRKEMEIAASMIARDLPIFPYAKVMAKAIPCTEVGGDFYDVIPVDDGFVAIFADVSGKGVSAALLASVIQGMMYAQHGAASPSSTPSLPSTPFSAPESMGRSTSPLWFCTTNKTARSN